MLRAERGYGERVDRAVGPGVRAQRADARSRRPAEFLMLVAGRELAAATMSAAMSRSIAMWARSLFDIKIEFIGHRKPVAPQGLGRPATSGYVHGDVIVDAVSHSVACPAAILVPGIAGGGSTGQRALAEVGVAYRPG